MTTVEELMEVYVNDDGEYVDSDDNKITFGDDVEKVIRISDDEESEEEDDEDIEELDIEEEENDDDIEEDIDEDEEDEEEGEEEDEEENDEEVDDLMNILNYVNNDKKTETNNDSRETNDYDDLFNREFLIMKRNIVDFFEKQKTDIKNKYDNLNKTYNKLLDESYNNKNNITNLEQKIEVLKEENKNIK